MDRNLQINFNIDYHTYKLIYIEIYISEYYDIIISRKHNRNITL